MDKCTHAWIRFRSDVRPHTNGCEECLKMGDASGSHLRLCMICRPCGLLRFIEKQARDRKTFSQDQTPDYALARARGILGLVLCGPRWNWTSRKWRCGYQPRSYVPGEKRGFRLSQSRSSTMNQWRHLGRVIRAVTYQIFCNRDILRGNSDFSLDENETVVLLGRSGSGKTTLLRMVNRCCWSLPAVTCGSGAKRIAGPGPHPAA